MFKLKAKERTVIFEQEGKRKEFKEGDKIKRRFLEGTQDKYECEVVFKEVAISDKEGNKTEEKEWQAFARRVGQPGWLLPLDETTIDEYDIFG